MKQAFAEKYKTLPVVQLVEITIHPDQYNPEALEAAREELSSRQVSSEGLEAARQKLDVKAEALHQNTSPLVRLMDWINSRIIMQIIPRECSATEKLIRVLCIYLVVMVAPDFYYFIANILLVAERVFSGHGLYELEVSLRIAVPVMIAFLLWTRHTAGWMLLCICLFAYVFPVITGWLLYAGLDTKDLLGFTFVDSLAAIRSTIIYSVILYFMNRKHTKELYQVGRTQQVIAAAIVLLLVLIKQATGPS